MLDRFFYLAEIFSFVYFAIREDKNSLTAYIALETGVWIDVCAFSFKDASRRVVPFPAVYVRRGHLADDALFRIFPSARKMETEKENRAYSSSMKIVFRKPRILGAFYIQPRRYFFL